LSSLDAKDWGSAINLPVDRSLSGPVRFSANVSTDGCHGVRAVSGKKIRKALLHQTSNNLNVLQWPSFSVSELSCVTLYLFVSFAPVLSALQ
jgi:hypothetical protein